MVRDHLATASDHLESAADATADDAAADRLAELAGQLDTLATRDRGPDHGRLARIDLALGEISDESAATDDIEAARDHVVSFRQTVEGV